MTVLSCTQPCVWHVAVEYLDIFGGGKKYSDTFARSMKLFQHLYSCPFSLHADSPEDEEYHHAIVLRCCYCRLFYVSENSFPFEPVLIHPRTYTPLYQHPPVI